MEHVESLLADESLLESITFTVPKKYSNYLVSKVKYNTDEMFIQFPKMKLIDVTKKGVELEFISESGYNSKVYNFLSSLDTHVIETLVKNSEEWFGKVIPIENIKQMYNNFIKAPKTSENKCTINFDFKLRKSELKTHIVNKKNEPIELDDLKINDTLECISQLKYIVFSKDTCFISWELITAKVTTKKVKVQPFGFIKDPDDQPVEEIDSDEENLISFF